MSERHLFPKVLGALNILVLLMALLAMASIDPIVHVLSTGNFQTNEPAFLVFGGAVCIINYILMMHRLSKLKRGQNDK